MNYSTYLAEAAQAAGEALNNWAADRFGIDPDVALSVAQTEFGVGRAELLSHRRSSILVTARAFAVWMLRSLGWPMSYSRIGRAIGGRDHATIINLHQKAIALRLTDPAFRGACERIQGRFNAMKEHSHA